MKIIQNDKIINRNKKISQYTLYLALAGLGIGIYLTLTRPAEEIGRAYLFLIPAYILVQISISLGAKWGKSPRPDEIVAQSLKGLDNQYSLYLFSTKVPHFLTGPSGFWVINAFQQTGKIYFDKKKNKYRIESKRGLLSKIFSFESLGNISSETKNHKQKLEDSLVKKGIESIPKIDVVNIFYGENIEVDLSNSPDILMVAGKLKDFIRKTAKKSNISQSEINAINKVLEDKL